MTSATKKQEQNEAQSIGRKHTPVTPTPMNRTKIGTRLSTAVKARPVTNRSSDLVPLSKDFEVMRLRLQHLITAAKAYHAAMISMDNSRIEVEKNLAILSEKSPIYELVGQSTRDNSLVSFSKRLSAKNKNAEEVYFKYVVEYAMEWQNVCTSRIDAGQKETKVLKDKLGHYQTKVEGLRKKVHNTTAKVKEPPNRLVSKVERNQGKLDAAWKAYETSASFLCNLLEEVTAQGWIDLSPLVSSFMKLEAERVAGQYDTVSTIPVALEAMKQIADGETEKPASSVASLFPASMTSVQIEHDDTGSETTGSYHEDTGDEDETPASPAAVATAKV